MSSWRLFAIWLVFAAGAVLVAWQIVAVADTQVGTRPVDVAASVSTIATQVSDSAVTSTHGDDDTTTTSTSPETGLQASSTTTTSASSASESTSPAGGSGATPGPGTTTPATTVPGQATTSTTAPSSPTTTTPEGSTSTTQSSESWSLKTITSLGGVVIVRHRQGEVELLAATPLLGFSARVDDDGPERVRVRFDGIDSDVEVRAEPGEQGLQIEVSGGN